MITDSFSICKLFIIYLTKKKEIGQCFSVVFVIKLSFFLLSLLGANNVLRLSFCLTHISSHNNKYYYFDYNKGLLLVKPLYLLRSNLSVTNRDVPKIQFVKKISY